jgi:TPP-dependent pyruvate/acetoin dehydrogenase alpha subunit
MVTTGIVGAGVPIAVGLALAAELDGSDRVAVASFGDGATSIGALHEAMNLAAVWNVPVVLLCQNNMWGEHTPLAEYTRTARLSDRAATYGITGVTVDGSSPEALYPVLTEAVERARRGAGPTFVEARTYRLLGHTFGADQSYQPPEELATAREAEPVKAFRSRLIGLGVADEVSLREVEKEVGAEVEDAIDFAKSSAPPGVSELLVDVFANPEELPV